MSRGDPARALGAGWSAVESDDAGAYRWITAPTARVVVPPARGVWRAIRVEAFQPHDAAPATLALAVGGEVLPAQPLRSGWADYEWQVPADRARHAAGRPLDVSLRVEPARAGEVLSASRIIAIASVQCTE
jgi:hypothetical protein